MIKKVSSILASNFKRWGIDHAFGIPGKAVTPLIVELSNSEIEFVLTKHESGAGFAAAGYALMNNKIGLAIGTSGPGGTNLLTAAGQAKSYGIPLLIITGHPSMKDTGKAMGQDSTYFGTDLVKMFEQVTKFSARVERADLVQTYLQHALEKAFSGVKGPVHLSIPGDVLVSEIENFELDLPTFEHSISSNIHNVVIELLDNSKKKVLFVGKGVHSSQAYSELKELAEIFNIPVMTTPGGKGTFESNHPLSLGAFGLGGTEEASNYIDSEIDLMIVLGTKLSDMSVAGLSPNKYPKKVIHFDYDLTFMGKTINVETIKVVGDIKTNIKKLLNIVRDAAFIKSDFNINDYKVEENVKETNENYMSSRDTLKILSKHLSDDTVIFGDDGSHTFYGIRYFDIKKPATFFFDDVFGTMGHAIGYAVGAKLAKSNTPIVCLTGDGCTFMHGSEISTAVNYGAHVIYVVLNNGILDMVDKGMLLNLGKAVGTSYSQPLDVKKYGESMGALSFKCRNADELIEAITIAKASKTTSVIEVLTDPLEIPPTTKRG